MKDIADELDALARDTVVPLRRIAEEEAQKSPGLGRWSKKEILGHLIDSAVNNLQRFVRAQLAASLVFPDYEQESWVRVQGYRERSWDDLIQLWSSLNAHLAHVVAGLPEECRPRLCTIGRDSPVTLEFLARDYVRHLRHHLRQICPEPAASAPRATSI